MKQINKEKIKRILIIRNDKIGDIVTSSGIFRELKKKFPKAKITFIGSKANKSLIEKNKNIDKIIILDYSPRKPKEFFSYLKLSRKLKKENFDLGIDLRGGFFNTLFLLFLPRVKNKIGFANQAIGRPLLHSTWEKDKINNNSAILRRDLINKTLNLKIKNYWPEIATDEDDQKALKKLILSKKLKNYICIIPDAKRELKQWPLERFDSLIKHLEKKYPKEQILLVGPDEVKINWLKKRNPKTIPIIGENLRTLYLLFQKSDLVVVHDGGIMHLAWAGNSKLLALLEKLLPFEYVKPLGKNSSFIYENLKKLSAEEVIKKVDKILIK